MRRTASAVHEAHETAAVRLRLTVALALVQLLAGRQQSTHVGVQLWCAAALPGAEHASTRTPCTARSSRWRHLALELALLRSGELGQPAAEIVDEPRPAWRSQSSGRTRSRQVGS